MRDVLQVEYKLPLWHCRWCYKQILLTQEWQKEDCPKKIYIYIHTHARTHTHTHTHDIWAWMLLAFQNPYQWNLNQVHVVRVDHLCSNIIIITLQLMFILRLSEKPKMFKIIGCHVWTMWWIMRHFPFLLLEPVFGCLGCVGCCTVIEYGDIKVELFWYLFSTSFLLCV